MGMLIGHFIPYVGRAQGGPVGSLRTLAQGLVTTGRFEVVVFGARLPGDGEPMDFDPRIGMHVCRAYRAAGFRWTPGMETAVRPHRGRLRLVHSHSLWTDVNRRAGILSRRLGVPHVISPCGTLNVTTMAHRRWKKRPIWTAFQGKMLRESACLHAKSDRELEDIRRLGLTNPVALIPNPVPGPEQMPEGGRFRSAYGIPEGIRLMLFLGRIHPLKRLPVLLDAWCALREWHDRWKLVIAGPEEGRHGEEIRAQVRESGVGDSVLFTGMLGSEEKWAALRDADYFVMPSDWENFGVSIAEALISGVPVITTRGNPWAILQEERCGWWVPPGSASLAGAMRRAFALSKSERSEMAERCRRVGALFDPQRVTRQMAEVYRWLLGEGDRPETVRTMQEDENPPGKGSRTGRGNG